MIPFQIGIHINYVETCHGTSLHEQAIANLIWAIACFSLLSVRKFYLIANNYCISIDI
ncbi:MULTISPECIES: hypothetical protein [Fischerella]|uniref:hypothetical protein n=1 Tax=Fischerella TaxID=1190 RepID=UPI0002DD9261|nr:MULTISPECIES: hypothetical protein [Fischerella]MBD2434678.1 hypothetical protein [Fischerella sp. FACHB-380]